MSASDIVELDVGGRLFKTTKTTLCKADYFKSFFERWNPECDNPIFIDRSPDGFAHVLDFFRDMNYKVPEKYQYELDFYGIIYRSSNIRFINKKLKELAKRSDKLDKDIEKLENDIAIIHNNVEKIIQPINSIYNVAKKKYNWLPYSVFFKWDNM